MLPDFAGSRESKLHLDELLERMDPAAFQTTRAVEDDAAIGTNPLRRKHVKRTAAVAANPEEARWRRMMASRAGQAGAARGGLEAGQ